MEFYRGDNIAWPYTYTVGGSNVDITDYIFIFTLNREKEPIDDSQQIYQVTATIVEAGDGELSFQITTEIEPGDYFYDIQVTKPNGNVRTLEKGKFKVIQDITKISDDDMLITEDGIPICTENYIAIITEG